MTSKTNAMDNIQLQNTNTNGNDGAAHVDIEPVAAGNGEGQGYPTERDGLLARQANAGNGETMPSPHEVEAQRRTNPEKCAMCRIKDQLNEKVFGVFRLWMIIVLILIAIIVVIVVSMTLCTVLYEDVDEKFDSSLFDVPLYFNGSFRLPNQDFTEDFLSLSSNKSQEVAAELQQKLADLYRTSPALGRYFSTAEIYDFRSGSVIAEYKLAFVMPADEQDQLRNFTLSREMVYNVLRQFLYDQEAEESELMYIDPGSLTMY
ncbi:TPA-induced transmembrane protein [Sphaeramia orbicularis]|uniref:SEA domain-containing protein n=1 Tax=Sphaeramia orbicularis TaxID=375764 RepID=A0A673AMV5_9TELE|nr:TPA-induced transmembrane protein [Sphaeramia orbicularis]